MNAALLRSLCPQAIDCLRGNRFPAGWLIRLAGVLALAVLLAGCAPGPVVDGESPACTGAAVAAGSELSEATQFVEVRLSFDGALEANGDVAGDLDVKLNGEAPDAKTVAVSAAVEGSDVVVRLAPTDAAANGGTTYFALYDGQLSIASARDDGALAHVRAAGGQSAAVLPEAKSFTVPSGVQIERVADEAPQSGEATLDITSFAKLRCCTWLRFSDALPAVRLHNHQFYRDTEKTCAQRLADTLNQTYGQWYSATCDGASVTVRANGSSIPLDVEIVEGEGALPGDDGGVGAWEEGEA